MFEGVGIRNGALFAIEESNCLLGPYFWRGELHTVIQWGFPIPKVRTN